MSWSVFHANLLHVSPRAQRSILFTWHFLLLRILPFSVLLELFMKVASFHLHVVHCTCTLSRVEVVSGPWNQHTLRIWEFVATWRNHICQFYQSERTRCLCLPALAGSVRASQNRWQIPKFSRSWKSAHVVHWKKWTLLQWKRAHAQV